LVHIRRCITASFFGNDPVHLAHLQLNGLSIKRPGVDVRYSNPGTEEESWVEALQLGKQGIRGE
jgi:hypothetical protein